MGDGGRNVGRLDRMLRVPSGMAAAVAACWVFLIYSLESEITTLLLLVVSAVIPVMTAATGTCGIYGIFGVNTCRQRSGEDDSKEAWATE